MCAAVQSVKGREGELWGLANLLELTNDTIKVMDTIADHDRREREVAEHLAGLLSHEFEAPPQAATGAIADLDRPLVCASAASCIRTWLPLIIAFLNPGLLSTHVNLCIISRRGSGFIALKPDVYRPALFWIV